MPYEWQDNRKAPANAGAFSNERAANGDLPPVALYLWPYRSLPKKGFVTFIAATALMLLLPLLSTLGTPVLWWLLPFLTGAIALIWYFLNLSYRSGEILEELCIWPDHIELIRQEKDGSLKSWDANPYWVTVQLIPAKGPVPNYLTIKGNKREVEIGAFLSEEERIQLYDELQDRLADIKTFTPN